MHIYPLCSSPTIKVFSPVQPSSPRSRVCRFVPVLSPVRKNIFAVPSSRFITVCPGRHTSTPGLINQDHPGGHSVHPGQHTVHPGQHTVHPGQHTVHYGSLRFIMVPYGSSRSTHGSSRSTPGSLRFIPVNTRFFQVNTRFEFSPRFDAGSTELSNMSHLLKFVPGLLKVIQGSSRNHEPWWWDCSIRIH